MWIVLLAAVLSTAVLIAYCADEDLADTIPVTVCGLILLLYLLSFGRGLWLMDYISPAVLAGTVFLLWKKSAGNREALTGQIRNPAVLIMLILLAVLTVCVKNEIFTWWDDINFWATDAKAIYYLNGFAGKYGNVAPEFGDYPPATSLFKWVFLHASPEHYQEGLQFAAYYCLNAVLLMPLLRLLGRRSIPVQAAGGILLLFLPGVINGILFYGTCADVTMGIAYGALLWAIWDHDGHSENWYNIRIALYAAVLVLTKSVGIFWALSAFVFLLCVRRTRSRKTWIPVLTVMAAEGSWLTFCLLMRRVAKLTSAGIHMAAGHYQLPDNTPEKIRYFLKGFLLIPMHSDQNFTLDLSNAAMFLILLLACLLLGRIKGMEKCEAGRVFRYLLLMGLLCYGFIFAAHITVFQTESQYLDAANMALSMSRYGAPFTMGGLYLLMGIALAAAQKFRQERSGRKAALICGICALSVLLTADYQGMYRAVIGYRAELSENRAYVSGMIDDAGRIFLKKTAGNRQLWGKRILYLRDDTVIHWVKDTYISSQASPEAVVYNGIDLSTMSSQTVLAEIQASHAQFLYVDPVAGDPGAVFDSMTEDGSFEYALLYRICRNNGTIILQKVQN